MTTTTKRLPRRKTGKQLGERGDRAGQSVKARMPRTQTPLLYVGAAIAFALPLATYVYFLCPTIAAGDSPELITAARVLGIPHPPGYPLFTLIGHIFTWIPLQSIAWRVNLMSAIFCSLACFLVYLSVLRLTGRFMPALTGALALAFSRYFWHYAEVAEVFALNNFFAALITYQLVLIRDIGQTNTGQNSAPHLPNALPRRFWLLAFCGGLALTNQHTMLLLIPAVLFFLWQSCPELLRNMKVLATGVAFFLLGLSPYLYLPIAASAQPLINWDNPVTFENFAHLLLRTDYGSFSPFATGSSTPRLAQVPVFFTGLWRQFAPVGILLALIGILQRKHDKQIHNYLWLAFLFSGIFFVIYGNVQITNPLLLGVLHRFYILPAIFFAFWIGLGFEGLLRRLPEKLKSGTLGAAGSFFLVLCLVIPEVALNREEADFRNNYVAEDFAYNLLLSQPRNALFFVRGDVASMGVDYLQLIDGVRPDVKTLDQTKLTYDWYYSQVRQRFPDIRLPGIRYDGTTVINRTLISENQGRFPVCFMDFKEGSYQEAFRALPHGLVFQMEPKNKPAFPEEWERTTNELYEQFIRRGLDKSFPATTFEYELQQIYAEPFFRLAYEFEAVRNFIKAEKYYRKAHKLNPANFRVLKNLAVLYFYKMNRKDEAVMLFERYLEMNPFDPEARSIREVVKDHQTRSG